MTRLDNTWDLVIRGGSLGTTGGTATADLGVHAGKIVQIGGRMSGRQELDARGLLVLPGGVDVHVHLSHPDRPRPGVERWVDDFYTGSLAAIGGGITTIGNMTFPWEGESLQDAVARDVSAASANCAVDYILHPVLRRLSPEMLSEIPALAQAGQHSLKIFMLFDDFDQRIDLYLEALRLTGRLGLLTMIHCEDGAAIRCACRILADAGRAEPASYPDSRPDFTEAAAVERAAAFARLTGAPLYVVHLSSALALEACRRARWYGAPLYVETRPLYLYLTRERFAEPEGAKYAGAPPLREPADVEKIWQGMATGDIQCLCSDHAPWNLRQKLAPGLDVATLPLGVADLETLMPMLFSEGVRKGRISLSRFVELTSTNAAKLFGLYPQKGTIAVGSDADLALWDPEVTRTINGASMQSKAGYSVYDGWSVTGWPVCTISRGEIVLSGNEFRAEPGRGRLLRQQPFSPP